LTLSPTQQAALLDKVWERLDARARQQLCSRSDAQGPAALADQVANEGSGKLGEAVVRQFLTEKCGSS